MHFAGSAAAVERAFRTGLERYRLAGGALGQATTAAIRVPSSIARAVAAVVGLDNLVRPIATPVRESRAPVTAAPRSAVAPRLAHPPGSPDACAHARTAAQQSGGLNEDQIANAYGAFGLYRAGDFASGQHIGVFELEPFSPSDVKTFDTCFFGARKAARMAGRLHAIGVDGGQPKGPGGGEAILDIDDVAALAPGAGIDVYESPDTFIGSLDNWAAIINDDVDGVVTSSWGACEQAVQLGSPGTQQAENLLLQQAAAQGQAVFVAVGDQGSDDCNGFAALAPPAGQNPLSVDDPGSQPYAIDVGGTTIDNPTQPPAEHVWNDGANVGATGGGISMSWTMPAWQSASRVPGIVLPGSSDYTQAKKIEKEFGFRAGFCQAFVAGATPATPCRAVPDVSAAADGLVGGITVYSSEFVGFPGTFDGWITLGGTSSSAPIWAALLAVMNASATCEADAVTAHGVGFVSPLLYAVASNPTAYAASFNDIRVGNNDIDGLDNGLVYPASTGYDLSTGLGTPKVTGRGGQAGLAFYLCSLARQGDRPTVTRLSPAVLPASGGTVKITGKGFEARGTAQVAAIQVGTSRVTPAKFTVRSGKLIVATFPPAKDAVPPASAGPIDGAGRANVIVTLRNGLSSDPTQSAALQYAGENDSSPIPSVTGISPPGGSEAAPAPVTIIGSGFRGATRVTFGGVEAKSFTVLSPFEIRATPARYGGSVRCGRSLAGQSPTTDICQVQVQVTNTHGTSAIGHILPPLEGSLPQQPDSMGVITPPPGCHCELQPAPTEFDYAPAPRITSVSTTTANPGSLASELTGSLITVTGRGFNSLTMDWATFGNPNLDESTTTEFTFLTGTKMQVLTLPAPVSVEPETLPMSVRTLAGRSPGVPVSYAGIPDVTSVMNTAIGRNGGPDTGGSPIAIKGHGFKQAFGPIEFVDAKATFSIGTQFIYTVKNDAEITTHTVEQSPGLVDVEVCSATACSLSPPHDLFFLFPPGNPVVDSINPASGPARGGTAVSIRGANLGCVTGVFFGKVRAVKFSNGKALLDCGQTTLVHAKAPPGKAGTKVKVTVTTIESEFTGTGPSKSSAMFAYK